MFGILVISKKVTNLKFGLGNENNDYDTFIKNLFAPFKRIINSIKFYFTNFG
jgi:hypothetical protein